MRGIWKKASTLAFFFFISQASVARSCWDNLRKGKAAIVFHIRLISACQPSMWTRKMSVVTENKMWYVDDKWYGVPGSESNAIRVWERSTDWKRIFEENVSPLNVFEKSRSYRRSVSRVPIFRICECVKRTDVTRQLIVLYVLTW